jgi:signal transduction histidine kinase/ActR/RegA family two-component response regulator
VERRGPEYQRLFESVPDLYLVLDARLRVVAVTDAFLAATRTRREDIVGRDVFEVIPDDPETPGATGALNLRASLRRVRRTGAPDTMAVRRHDVRRPPEEGGGLEERYWSPINVPVLDEHGSLAYIVHRVNDVTEFVRLQVHDTEQAALTTELRERLERMRTEILLRSSELEQANRQLRAASDAKNEFLSRMSHELRSPLTAVIGFSELLGHSELDGRQRDRLAMIRKASEHLLALMNEVLDLSRIESGSISVSAEPIAIETLLDDALSLLRPAADAREVVVHPAEIEDGAEFVFADNQRLKQVLLNLLSNAIKYNRPQGEVRIWAEPEGEDEVRITIADTGRGLDETAIGKLFVPFERLDAASVGIEGTGLGLVLSRTLLEAMSGSIGVSSEPGRGSRFWVLVPRGTPVPVARPGGVDDPILAIRTSDEPRSVLYVEDMLTNVLLIRGLLEQRPNVHLLSAAHGQIGLELAREHRPDLILLDLHLPDLPGDKVLALLRADEATRRIPVVVISADAKREREQLLAAGASAYLTKPVGLRRLLQVIDRFLYERSPAEGARGERSYLASPR